MCLYRTSIADTESQRLKDEDAKCSDINFPFAASFWHYKFSFIIAVIWNLLPPACELCSVFDGMSLTSEGQFRAFRKDVALQNLVYIDIRLDALA